MILSKPLSLNLSAIDIITNDFPTTNILNKYIKYINLGDPIAVLGFIDSVLGSVDLWRGNFGLIMGNLGFDSYCDHYIISMINKKWIYHEPIDPETSTREYALNAPRSSLIISIAALGLLYFIFPSQLLQCYYCVY